VTRTDGIDDAFNDLLAGKADYLIAGYYPGLAEAAKDGIKDKVVPLDQALLSQEMFVAFSKKSPCRSLADKFGQQITVMTTNGSYDNMVTDATKTWDAAQPKQ
jgi:polar amino acid transport system substrate-binding protein